MDKNTFLRSFEEILEIDEGLLTGTELLSEFEGWDSLAIIQLVAMLDTNNAKLSSLQAVCQFQSVNDLFENVERA